MSSCSFYLRFDLKQGRVWNPPLRYLFPGLLNLFQLILFISFALLFFCPSISLAEKSQPSAISSRLEGEKKNLIELNRQIEAQKREIKALKIKEESIFLNLRKIGERIEASKKDIELSEEKLQANNSEKSELITKISEINESISKNKDLLFHLVVSLYKKGRPSYLEIVFSSATFSDFLTRVKYFEKLTTLEANLIERQMDQEKKLNEMKKLLIENEEKIKNNLEAISLKKQEAEKERNEKGALVEDVKAKKERYIQLVKESEEAGKKLQNLIRLLEEEQKKSVVTFTPGSFKQRKGSLRWPVFGKVITPFGKVTDGKFNVQSFNNGIEISTGKAEEVKAVHDGKIIFSDWFEGYGKLIILDNGGGFYTLYGHLSKLLKSVGEVVRDGGIIGLSGDTDSINGSNLYFEIRASGSPVNPEKWLKR